MPIFDQGYQHWSGSLSGHGWRWLAIARHGVRAGLKGWALRIVLMTAWAPALALAAFLCLWGMLERGSSSVKTIMQFLVMMNPGMAADPRHYRVAIWTLAYHFFLGTELYFSLALILLVGPSLISQDLRFNALPLYFSRPLRRIDYFLGKLGVIAAFLGMVIIGPSVAAYVLGMLFSLDISILRDTFGLLLSAVLYGVILAVSAGMLMLALSALSRNSRYVMLMWLAVWLISGITADVLQVVEAQRWTRNRYEEIVASQPVPARLASRPTSWVGHRRSAWFQARSEYAQQQPTISLSDWRPIISYANNLARIERALIGSDDSWRVLSILDPPQERERFLGNALGAQYPWYWSALILAGLFGISACMLHYSIRSLDRLR